MNTPRILTAIAMLTISVHASAPLDLRADGNTAPLAASPKPHLTARIESNERNITATAWQILVATDPSLLEEEKADLWDSGKTPAKRTPGLTYAGKTPPAATTCHWKIRYWSADDKPSPWSDPSTWEVAPQTPADWKAAKWMDDGRANPTNDEDFYKNDPAPLMRREFKIEKPITRARLHIAGLGLSLPSLNGKPIVDQIFDPAWTQFDKRILFRTHDITKLLSEGDNCFGIELGNGWYNPLPLRMWSHRNIRGSIPTGRPRAIALLIIDHPDGTSTTITSGSDWKTTQGPTLRNSIYLGEVRDARLEKTDWNTPGYDASSWQPVNPTDDSLAPLQALHMPPARLKQAITAKSVKTISPGLHIVDFGINLTAIPEIDLDLPPGTEITFRYGELLNPDGTLNALTSVAGQIKGMKQDADGNSVPKGGPGAPEYAWQQNTYITKGGGETFRPKFTYHGFRYMEIKGLPDTPKKSSLRIFPLHTALPDAGTFVCSNHDLNHIQEITRRTFLSNVITVQSDCPHRERFGYGGDIVATSEAYMMNFDMAAFYAKTVRDWADAARPDGRLTDTAPFVGIDYCGVGWAMVHPLLLEQLHQVYGAETLLQEQVPIAMKWLDGVAATRKDGLVTNGLGDHEALIPSKGPEYLTPKFIDSALRLARLCRLIGKTEDAARYEALAAESQKAWAAAYLDTETGIVGKGHQTPQLFALGFHAAPTETRTAIFDHLVKDLTAPEDAPRLTTGIYGTRILLEELSANGRTDLAYALADREDFPSWKWMLKNGATSLWEHWEKEENTFSHNHPMFGSISAWFFRWLGGIQPAPDAVAFDKILIRPQTPQGLEWVKTSHQTVRGTITSDWKISENTREFTITIPPTATAIIELPAKPDDTLTEDGKALTEIPAIKTLRSPANIHRMQTGSGTYRFKITTIP
jgi:alpha-L-rhamnosidase